MSTPGPQMPQAWPWVRSAWCDAAAVAWGAAEGSLFFVVPDILITLSAGVSPRRGLRHLAFVIVGSFLAGIAMFLWGARAPEDARRMVESVPFVQPSMFERVERDFEKAGVWALCLGPTSGIPYKVYAVTAPRYTSLGAFAAVSIPARAERLLITWAQFAVLGWLLRKFTKNPMRWLVVLHAVYWFVVYALYWGSS
jgi:hypothetical protein